VNSEEQDNVISLYDVETKDDKNEEDLEISQPHEESPEDDANKQPEPTIN
jgi:hypothetical protein